MLFVIRFGSFGKEHGNVKAKSKKEKDKTKTEAQGKHTKPEPESKFISFMALKQKRLNYYSVFLETFHVQSYKTLKFAKCSLNFSQMASEILNFNCV